MRNLTLIACLVLPACATQYELSEPEIREHIIGAWQYFDKPSDHLYYAESYTFYPSGKGSIADSGGCVEPGENSIKWRVMGSLLKIDFENGGENSLDSVTSFEVVSLSSRELALKNVQTKKVRVFKRL